MRPSRACTMALGVLALTGCADQLLSADRTTGSIAAQLGIAPSDVTIVTRTNDGPTNTVFLVDAKGQGRFVCTINGGNALTFGMINGAFCRRPGGA